MQTTSTFSKMGDDGMASLVNVSGQRSPYTMPEARKGPTSPDMGGGNAGGLSHTQIPQGGEMHGPAFRPMATRGWGAEYSATGRNTRMVPSALGNRDFWDARARAGE